MKNLKVIDGDYDFKVEEKVINGRITKARYKAIARQVRKGNWWNRCSCEHDCCGHVSSVRTNIISADSNQMIIHVRTNYNY